MSSNMDKLPDECIQQILGGLGSTKEQLNAGCVNNRLRAAAAVVVKAVAIRRRFEAQRCDSLQLHLEKFGEHVTSISISHGHPRPRLSYLEAILPPPPAPVGACLQQLPSSCCAGLQEISAQSIRLQLGPCRGSQSVLHGATGLTRLVLQDCVATTIGKTNNNNTSSRRRISAGLASLTNLRHLSWCVNTEAVDGATAGPHKLPGAALSSLVRLTHLRLVGQDDAALAHLGRLTNLQQLLLAEGDVTAAGLAALQQVPALTRLELTRRHSRSSSDASSSSSSLTVLSELTGLQHLVLGASNLRVRATQLGSLLQLRHLDIACQDLIGEEPHDLDLMPVVLAVLARMLHLTHLSLPPLDEVWAVDHEAYGALTACSGLCYLDGSYMSVGDEAWTHAFAAGRQLPHLTQLKLVGASPQFDAEDFAAMVRCCPNLRALSLYHEAMEGPADDMDITPVSRLTALTSLQLDGLNDSNMWAIAALSQLRHLHAACSTTTDAGLLQLTVLTGLTSLQMYSVAEEGWSTRQSMLELYDTEITRDGETIQLAPVWRQVLDLCSSSTHRAVLPVSQSAQQARQLVEHEQRVKALEQQVAAAQAEAGELHSRLQKIEQVLCHMEGMGAGMQ